MEDVTAPATKADVRRLENNIHSLDIRVRSLETAVAAQGVSLHAAIDQVLTVLTNVNERLTQAIGDHERRITKLERHLGLAH